MLFQRRWPTASRALVTTGVALALLAGLIAHSYTRSVAARDPGPLRPVVVATHEVSREYAERYQEATAALREAPAEAPSPEESETDEDALRWMFLDERGRVGELAKLTGQLRYAVEVFAGEICRIPASLRIGIEIADAPELNSPR